MNDGAFSGTIQDMLDRQKQYRNDFAEASDPSKMNRWRKWRLLRATASVLKAGFLVITVAVVAGWVWSWSQPRNAVGNWFREEGGGRIVRTICGVGLEHGVICFKWDCWRTDLDPSPQVRAEQRENIAAIYEAMGGWRFSSQQVCWEFEKPSNMVVTDVGQSDPQPPQVGISRICFTEGTGTRNAWLIGSPIWAVALACGAWPGIAAAIWIRGQRLRKLAKPGFCVQCGYDLRATPDRCPECGAIARP